MTSDRYTAGGATVPGVTWRAEDPICTAAWPLDLDPQAARNGGYARRVGTRRRSRSARREHLAGLGGALAVEIVGLDHAFALTYLVYVLIVVAVGGLGTIGGSLAAALLLGVSDMAGKYYVPQLGAFFIYLVMVALLMWRPLGLFGRR